MGRRRTFGWVLCLAFVIVIVSNTASANLPISIQTSRPSHPELVWLKRFLILRGYQPKMGPGKGQDLALLLQTRKIVWLKRGRQAKRYELPGNVQAPRVRARLMAMYVSLFVDALRAGKVPQATPSAPPTKSLPPRRRPSLSMVPNLRTAPRSPKRYSPQRFAARHRARRRPPATRRRVAPVPVVVRRRATPRPRVAIVPVVPRRRVPPRLLALVPKRAKVQRKVTRKRRVVRATRVRVVRSVPPKTTQVWGDVLSLDLGISGGFRWSNFERVLAGGQLLFGFNFWRWTVRAELAFETYYLTREARTIALMRPAFWLGWQVPFGAIERTLRLQLLLGVGSEFFVREKATTYTDSLAWGILAGLQLHYWFATRWSLFVRPGLLVLPGGFTAQPVVGEVSSTPPIQLNLLLGLQVRL